MSRSSQITNIVIHKHSLVNNLRIWVINLWHWAMNSSAHLIWIQKDIDCKKSFFIIYCCITVLRITAVHFLSIMLLGSSTSAMPVLIILEVERLWGFNCCFQLWHSIWCTIQKIFKGSNKEAMMNYCHGGRIFGIRKGFVSYLNLLEHASCTLEMNTSQRDKTSCH